MARKKRSAFRGKVHKSMKKRKQSKFGYLNLPEGINQFKAEGRTEVVFDILPYLVTDEHHLDRDDEDGVAIPGEEWYRKSYRVHRDVGPDQMMVVCPTSIGKKCPICEYAKKRRDEGADFDEELKNIVYKTRSLYAIVLLDASECEEKYKEGEIHVFDMSDHLFWKILDEEVDHDVDHEVFPDLEEGLSLRVRFAEDKFGKQTFAKTSRIDFEERKEQYGADFIEQVPNLDEILKVYSYKELEAMYFEMDDVAEVEEDTEEFEEEAAPATDRKKKNTRRRDPEPEEEEEEPEEEEPEEEEEEEEEKKPAKRTRQSKPESGKDKCPHGHKYAVDTDEYDECYECEIWDACSAAKENK